MKQHSHKDSLVKLKEWIRTQGNKDQALLEELVDHYFVAISHDELAALPTAELYARYSSHFEFMKCRQPQQIKLRVFNSTQTEEGFTSKHSVIQLSQNDMPFLVDSLLMELHRRNVAIHFIMHNGAVPVVRDANGAIIKIDEHQEKAEMEANVFIEVDHQEGEAELMALQDPLYAVLSDVGLAVTDFISMRDTMAGIATHLQDQSRTFLEWLCDNHFTFLGYAVYRKEGGTLKRDPGSSLGLMKDQSTYGVGSFDEDFRHMPDTLTDQIVICKSEHESTVHRSAYMDAILIPEFNAKGELEKEHRFVGLYTSRAYHLPSSEIPFLSQKVANVYKRTHFAPGSHDIKTLEDIIESFPKDELFQMSEDELYQTAMSVLYIQERLQVKVLLRRDIFGRFYRIMIYLPRDLYTTRLRTKFQEILLRELNGISASFTPLFLPSVLCRVDFIIRVADHAADSVDLANLEGKIKDVARNWTDGLYGVLVEAHGEHEGKRVYQQFNAAFPINYQGDFSPRVAIHDIENIQKLLDSESGIVVEFEKDQGSNDRVHLKVMQSQAGLWLTDVLPILENFGLKVIEERPYEIAVNSNLIVWLSDFVIDGTGLRERFDEMRNNFKEAFLQVWYKEIENDGFNRLTLLLGLSFREVVLLRAIGKYLVQIGFAYGQKYFEDTLSLYPHLTHLLVEMFFLRFDPQFEDRSKLENLYADFEAGLSDVQSLDHDQILRKYFDVIKAMIRTNYFQKTSSGTPKSFVSFKLNPELIPDLPKPIPFVEIFVYSPDVEGVHLRGAKVARGGIRWSDRALDFRTEVLGLMKAQQVKNAVIVPLGAKGGFYPKQLQYCQGREEIQKEAIRCYQIYISAMLDITDNIIADKIVPPVDVVRYDEDDPYFVVAADKGTATFSDIANGIAESYNFWLGDAFASGGSNGYDHKKMGITARGAWESVKRHFLFLNKDIQKEDFTVVGIGDMAGDVFGNGMLLSKHIRLVAAFNHMHIFLDPNPDGATSFAERKRLFKLPRSSWEDYNPELITQGGGVYARSLKTIPISPEVKAALGIEANQLEPNLLIHAILKAPVELLWNGGIGTYVKASTQNNVDVGDRTNDPLRVSANELRCQVIGEGGNLGLTQLARVEYALLGGQVCMDAVDNSAGVDCSDHEVNIKILLNAALEAGKLNQEERNKLLSDMGDEVANLVLADNYHQTQVISNGVNQRTAVTTYIRLLRELEREGFIDRALEGLPQDKVLKARMSQGKSFTKPEFSVLMAYAKTSIKKIFLESDLPEEGYFSRYLKVEFPKELRERFLPEMKNHRLRREIIVTQLTNDMTQYLGIAYVHRMYDEVGAFPAMSARAFTIAKELFDMETLWQDIEALDGKVSAEVQIMMMNELTYFLDHQCRWLLRHFRNDLFVESIIRVLKSDCTELLGLTRHYLNADQLVFRKAYIARFTEKGVPKALAERIADCYYLYSILDMIHAARSHQIELSAMIETFYTVSQMWGLSWLRQKLNEMAELGYWEMLTSASLKDDLNRYEATIVVNILEQTKNNQPVAERIEEWSSRYPYFVRRWHILLADFKISQVEFVRTASLLNSLRDLAEFCER